MVKLLQRLALDIQYVCLQFFREIFTDKCKESGSRSSSACNALNFFSRIVKSAASIANEQPCEDARL